MRYLRSRRSFPCEVCVPIQPAPWLQRSLHERAENDFLYLNAGPHQPKSHQIEVRPALESSPSQTILDATLNAITFKRLRATSPHYKQHVLHALKHALAITIRQPPPLYTIKNVVGQPRPVYAVHTQVMIWLRRNAKRLRAS